MIKMLSKFANFKAEQDRQNRAKIQKEERGKLFEVVVDWFFLKNTKNKRKQTQSKVNYQQVTEYLLEWLKWIKN